MLCWLEMSGGQKPVYICAPLDNAAAILKLVVFITIGSISHSWLFEDA